MNFGRIYFIFMSDNHAIQFLYYLYSVIKSSYRVHLQSTTHIHSHHRSAVFKHFEAYTENCLPSGRMNAGFLAMPRITIKILFSGTNISKNMCKIPWSTSEEERRSFENSWLKEIFEFMMRTDLEMDGCVWGILVRFYDNLSKVIHKVGLRL